ncbi:hypothetical protein CDD83_956 [Cordyceps sp. RAO-2017]|nr:hypothetical protein CDD83_956 [Cordyceps sp. RAO-2017]
MERAEAQWIEVEIKNRMRSSDVSVKNARLDWGKFYKGSKSREIKPHEVNQTVVAPGAMEVVSSCGRAHAASGTNGDFDLYDGNTKICNIYWDCPWGTKANDFAVRAYDPDASAYSVVAGRWNTSGGAIGNVSITIAKYG